MKFVKRSKKLPVVLSRDEIDKILSKTATCKYRLMIALAYGCGLQISEVINLKVGDLDMDELTIAIRKAKGKRSDFSIAKKAAKMICET